MAGPATEKCEECSQDTDNQCDDCGADVCEDCMTDHNEWEHGDQESEF